MIRHSILYKSSLVAFAVVPRNVDAQNIKFDHKTFNQYQNTISVDKGRQSTPLAAPISEPQDRPNIFDRSQVLPLNLILQKRHTPKYPYFLNNWLQENNPDFSIQNPLQGSSQFMLTRSLGYGRRRIVLEPPTFEKFELKNPSIPISLPNTFPDSVSHLISELETLVKNDPSLLEALKSLTYPYLFQMDFYSNRYNYRIEVPGPLDHGDTLDDHLPQINIEIVEDEGLSNDNLKKYRKSSDYLDNDFPNDLLSSIVCKLIESLLTFALSIMGWERFNSSIARYRTPKNNKKDKKKTNRIFITIYFFFYKNGLYRIKSARRQILVLLSNLLNNITVNIIDNAKIDARDRIVKMLNNKNIDNAIDLLKTFGSQFELAKKTDIKKIVSSWKKAKQLKDSKSNYETEVNKHVKRIYSLVEHIPGSVQLALIK